MTDYRLAENRLEYFKSLYWMNLVFKVSPGLVYLYMPALKEYYSWDDETALWFATINGHTPHPRFVLLSLSLPLDPLSCFNVVLLSIFNAITNALRNIAVALETTSTGTLAGSQWIGKVLEAGYV